jgi:hypothetical protein
VFVSLTDRTEWTEPRSLHAPAPRRTLGLLAKHALLPDSIVNPRGGKGWGAFGVGQMAAGIVTALHIVAKLACKDLWGRPRSSP